jgi:hypothetical protein
MKLSSTSAELLVYTNTSYTKKLLVTGEKNKTREIFQQKKLKPK